MRKKCYYPTVLQLEKTVENDHAFEAPMLFRPRQAGAYAFIGTDRTKKCGANWQIYALESRFQEGLRYLPQAWDPQLTDDGMLTLSEDCYVYIGCDVNGFTMDNRSPGQSTLRVYRVID